MINTLDEYISKSMSDPGDFVTSPGLAQKVGRDKAILPYEGNTVVFLLHKDTRQALQTLQDELYDAAPGMLAEPLVAGSFHMTLHSLADGPAGTPGLPDRMDRMEAQARTVLAAWTDPRPLQMEATWMFNMVHTSIVLGLKPADPVSWQRLSEMYLALEQVRPLGYAMTPHITLAYFRPGTYGPDAAAPLRDALRPVCMHVTLRMEDLVIQRFRDMNSYETRR